MPRSRKDSEIGRASGRLLALLRGQLLSGRIAAGEFMPSVRQLGEQHGIACKTVQRALRQLAAEGLIAAESRLGYRVMSRVNDPERGCPLAVIMPAERRRWDELVVGLVEELRAVAASRGRTVLTIGTGEIGPEGILDRLHAARAWGAVVSVTDSGLLERIRAAELPAVLVETWEQGSGFDTVVQDGFRGAMAAAEWLIARGHRRIAWFGRCPRNGHPQIAERFAGALAGLARAGLEIPAELRFDDNAPGHEELVEPARRMLSGRNRPEAVLALWQPHCQALASAARLLGLVPGKDFAMVGWTTLESMANTYAPLFSGGEIPPAVAWSVRAMAETALARIEERRARPSAPPITLQIPAQLVVSGRPGSAADNPLAAQKEG